MVCEGSQKKMPARHQSLSLGHLWLVLLTSSLVLSSHPLWAQKSVPREEVREAKAGLDPELGFLPDAPESQTKSHGNPFLISHHYNLINPQAALNLHEPAGTGELLRKSVYFSDSASSPWPRPAYGKLHHSTINPVDRLQYYSHYVPWLAPSILRVSQEAKAHPHVISVLTLFQPQF